VSDAINKLLQNLVIRCAKEDGIRDYFYVGVVGYGASVGSAYAGSLAGKDLVPISEIANSPARIDERSKKVDDGAGGLVDRTVRFPIWYGARTQLLTPYATFDPLGFSSTCSWFFPCNDHLAQVTTSESGLMRPLLCNAPAVRGDRLLYLRFLPAVSRSGSLMYLP